MPAWPRQPVLPGDSAEITVKYNTKKVGTINKSIYVYSNAKQSTLTLKIQGKVEAASATTLPEKNLDKNGAPVNK
ncbi:MAG: DUF1573 domain-containing protein [Bacteroidales bacterium]|nr:DUF1573 domain-containing protein [Bacteroidales bacterium]MCF8404002.1 DUF1573 domain-containing protein [Bacteroidales bacterium]